MRIFANPDEYNLVKKPVVTVGTFDGVHLGHQKILEVLNEKAKQMGQNSLAVTFWPHPRYVLDKDGQKLKLLNTLSEKQELFDKAGIDNMLIIPFTEEFSKQKPDEFLQSLIINKLKASALVVGYDHRFGNQRSGSISFLEKYAHEFPLEVIAVDALEILGTSVSSTRIRNALAGGEIYLCNTLLGYHYSLSAKVVKGFNLGKKLGYPTANLELQDKEKMLPADGIYIVSVIMEGISRFGMLNIGDNPTIPEKGRSMEVHIFDFGGDIYGKKLTVSFLHRLRNEEKFNSLEELKLQMDRDKENSLRFLRNYIPK